MTDTTATAAKPESKTGTTDTASSEAKAEAKDTAATNAESGTVTENSASDAPTGYSRGENQKPVTNAYRSNWEKIFGDKSAG